ncbi:MAG: hypothetical protein ISQ11_15090 [Planctomycetes bacterium]|nr:hypothetical protein [Planctomycetota bacterium]
MSYDPFEVLQEKVAAPRSQGAEREAVPATPSISLAEAAEQSGLPEAVLAAAVRKGTLNTHTIADDGVLQPGVQLDEVEFARESLITDRAPRDAGEDGAAVEPEPTADEGPAGPDSKAQPEPEPEPEPEPAGSSPSDEERAQGAAAADEDRGGALVEVELAVQGWREAKEALEVAREEHRAELVRLERVIVASEAREASTRRWGRAAAVAAGVLLLGAAGFVIQLQSEHGETLSTERARAGLLEGQLQAAGQQLEQRAGEVERQAEAAAAAASRASQEAARAEALASRVSELEADRAAAAAAWEQALSSMGWR